jgi:transcriptional regulator of acetoin/glycerol metabolism
MDSSFSKARSNLELSGHFSHDAVAKPIADSWERCINLGLNPNSNPDENVLSNRELNLRREKLERVHMLARPELELLSSQIAGSNYLIAFADNEGVVLDQIMDTEFKNSICGKSIIPGSVWSESARGTNALGLSIHTGESSKVTGLEHYFSAQAKVSCVAAPIYNSHQELVGLLDASSEISARQNHTNVLVNLAASNIENRLFIEENSDSFIILLHPRQEYLATQSAGMIALNHDGKVLGINRRAIEILAGMNARIGSNFSDLFHENYSLILDRLVKNGETKITDWLQSVYFARLIPNHSNSNMLKIDQVLLPIEPVSQNHAASLIDDPGFIFDDEALQYNMKLATKSIQVGSTVIIQGEYGTGKKIVAQDLHKRTHRQKAFITIDCETVSLDSINAHFIANIQSSPGNIIDTSSTSYKLESGGTLFLDKLDCASPEITSSINTLIDNLLHNRDQESNNKWVIISSSTLPISTLSESESLRSLADRLFGFELVLPELNKRTDFHKLALSLMKKISPQHFLNKSAIDSLQAMSWENNFHSFDQQLRLLAVHAPEGIINEDQIFRVLGPKKTGTQFCQQCAGHSIKESLCLEIRTTFQNCNYNVALTARQLGLSRNTIYLHTKNS